ncbi:MAG: ABC transporter ATP-binding protein [Coriobacteriales bacterium]|jgi:ABC-2 type transport system ATP-binding protein|nr:ABC transporter ATP-binding protein [Coriobacteriales bacterium]
MQALVEIQGVRKRFGRQEVLRHIDLTLEPGCITGLLGPSGSGKTTIVNLIVGSITKTAGTITVLGKPAPPQGVRKEMGFMPQSEALYNDLTAGENLNFFGALYGMSKKQLAVAIPRVLGLVRLGDEGKKVVASFSGGMKRRLSLAIALLHQPRLLVLDEPTIGLDPLHRVELWKSFYALAREGSGLLITTHVMDEALGCDKLIMIHDGRIIAQGSPEELIVQAGTETLEEAFLRFEELEAESEAEDNTGEKPKHGRGSPLAHISRIRGGGGDA